MRMSKSEADAVLQVSAQTFGTCNEDYKTEFGFVIFERMLNENLDSRKVFRSYGLPQEADCPITIPMLQENEKMKVRIPRQFAAMRKLIMLIEQPEAFYKTGIRMGKAHVQLDLELEHLRALEEAVLQVLCENYNMEFGSTTYDAFKQVLADMTDVMWKGMIEKRQNMQ